MNLEKERILLEEIRRLQAEVEELRRLLLGSRSTTQAIGGERE